MFWSVVPVITISSRVMPISTASFASWYPFVSIESIFDHICCCRLWRLIYKTFHLFSNEVSWCYALVLLEYMTVARVLWYTSRRFFLLFMVASIGHKSGDIIYPLEVDIDFLGGVDGFLCPIIVLLDLNPLSDQLSLLSRNQGNQCKHFGAH